jgi:hypothetical protein
MDDKIRFDIDSVTYRELIEIEEQCGRNAVDVLNDIGRGSTKETAVVSWIVQKRSTPDLTLDEVLDRGFVADMDRIVFVADEPDPTEPAA